MPHVRYRFNRKGHHSGALYVAFRPTLLRNSGGHVATTQFLTDEPDSDGGASHCARTV